MMSDISLHHVEMFHIEKHWGSLQTTSTFVHVAAAFVVLYSDICLFNHLEAPRGTKTSSSSNGQADYHQNHFWLWVFMASCIQLCQRHYSSLHSMTLSSIKLTPTPEGFVYLRASVQQLSAECLTRPIVQREETVGVIIRDPLCSRDVRYYQLCSCGP